LEQEQDIRVVDGGYGVDDTWDPVAEFEHGVLWCKGLQQKNSVNQLFSGETEN